MSFKAVNTKPNNTSEDYHKKAVIAKKPKRFRQNPTTEIQEVLMTDNQSWASKGCTDARLRFFGMGRRLSKNLDRKKLDRTDCGRAGGFLTS